jgi:hypothetical protein
LQSEWVDEALSINVEGQAVSMRQRGILKKVPALLLMLRESACALAVKAWEEGWCGDDWHEKRKAAAKERDEAKAKASVPVEVTTRRRAQEPEKT